MTQIVFIHGPGAGGCPDSFVYQLEYYPGSLAPTLPGHPDGAPCANVEPASTSMQARLANAPSHDFMDVSFILKS